MTNDSIKKLADAGYSSETIQKLLGVSRKRMAESGAVPTGRRPVPERIRRLLARKPPQVPEHLRAHYHVAEELMTRVPGTKVATLQGMFLGMSPHVSEEWHRYLATRQELTIAVFNLIQKL